MMSMSSTRTAGEIVGESTVWPQPCESSFTSTPAIAGSAIMKTICVIMLTTSSWTVSPRSTLSDSGMVKGASTVDTRMVARASDRSPSYMPHHRKHTTATGTQYSSVAPMTRLGLAANRMPERAREAAGITTSVTARMASMLRGWRKTSSTSCTLLLSEPWNVMMANITGTARSVTPKTSGNRTPVITHSGAMNIM